MGGGVEIHLLVLRITPDIRYTRWGNQQFSGILPPGEASGITESLRSSQNQAEF